MFRHLSKVAVRIAVAQVIIVAFGVLGTGATQDWWTLIQRNPPPLTLWVLNWGVTLMTLPIVWTLWWLKVHRDTHASEELKRLATQLGIIIAGFLFLLLLWSSLNVVGYMDGYDPGRKVDELGS